MKVSGSVVIRRPIEEVFKFVATDYFHNMPKWSEQKEQIYLVCEEPIHEGFTARVVTECTNCGVESLFVVTEYKPNERMVIEDTTHVAEPRRVRTHEDLYKTTKFIRIYQFEPVPEGTRFTSRVESNIEPSGLYNLLMPLLALWANTSSQRMPYKIADLIEGPSKTRAVKVLINRALTSRIIILLLILLLFISYTASEILHWSQSWKEAISTLLIGTVVIWTIANILFVAFSRRLGR